MSNNTGDDLLDVLIVGAGISGINAAVRLSAAGRSFHIVERRERIGGTWDLFRYPGIRSDSDIYTLSFGYHPWHERNTIADGADIRDYLEHAARDYGVDSQITFSAKVTGADFRTDTDTWTVRVDTPAGPTTYRARFLYLCTGYYNYDDGYTPEFPGIADFTGQVIHPQHWPEGLDCAGKEVTVIGSGATAVTLVPSLARAGAKVSMLQRSPSYVYPITRADPVVGVLRKVLPPKVVQHFARIWLGGFSWIMYHVCRRAPGFAKWFIRRRISKLLPADYPVDVHFKPRYNPWDQRVCADTDGDLFEAINAGGVQMVTDTIDTFTPSGIRLGSGAELRADVIITATGLNLQIFGGIELSVDGVAIDAPKRFIYKGYLIEGVPNAAWSVGYTNASWTLRADLSARAVVRLLDYMERRGYTHAYPDRHGEQLEARPFFNLSSGYVSRGDDHMPRSGVTGPWAIRHNYVLDFLAFHRDRIDENMVFGTVSSKAVSPRRVTMAPSALSIGAIVLRVDDLQRQMAFWSAALDYVPRETPTADWVVLTPRVGSGPNLSLDRHPSVSQIPPRLHLDLYTDDQHGEVARLIRLGATRIDWPRPPGADFVTLEDPEGNRLDVVQFP